MQRIKRTHSAAGGSEAEAFAFCDRTTGAIRFQVRAAADGELPTEEAASLLAMHCLVRGQQPGDYIVLVVPRQHLLGPVNDRAQQLLATGRKVAGLGVSLSARQREVLDHVLQDRSNKEIGARLNVTERTVKFHVSQLLAKFKARDRAGLKQEAAIGMLPASAVPGDTLFGFPVSPDVRRSGTSRVARMLNFRGSRESNPEEAAVTSSVGG